VIIGAAFVQWATWRWILWFTAILGFAIAIASTIVVPPSTPRAIKPSWKRLDLGGVSLITASVILFIYSVTSGSTTSWVKPAVLAPLFVSVVMAIGFFVYEATVDEDLAALPPKVWRYNNVPILIGIALLPFLWWAARTFTLIIQKGYTNQYAFFSLLSVFFQQMPLMEQQYGWSPIMTSIHFLPTGFCSMIITPFVPPLVKAVSPKWAIIIGLGLEFIASMILPFANSAARYYSFLIPAMAM
jgi:MFS family permease